MIDREDFDEPRCPFCIPNEIERVPLYRIREKFDGYMIGKDYSSAERLLLYWISEADYGGDIMGKLSLYNELTGLYRKTGEKDKCYDACAKCFELLNEDVIKGKIIEGTTILNIATSKKTFDKNAEAIKLYDRAQVIYENLLDKQDFRLCGLYNNKAVALSDTGEYQKAEELFNKAISLLEQMGGQETELAVTYCNLTDSIYNESGDKENVKIKKCLDKAKECFDSTDVKYDYNYAYACEICAKTFGTFGDIIFQNELEKRAKEIYERA